MSVIPTYILVYKCVRLFFFFLFSDLICILALLLARGLLKAFELLENWISDERERESVMYTVRNVQL